MISIAHDRDDEDLEVRILLTKSERFGVWAFKIATDPFVGRLCFVREYSGNSGVRFFRVQSRWQ